MAEEGSRLYPALHAFMVSQGLTKTAKQFLLEAALGKSMPAAEEGVVAVLEGLAQIGKRPREGNGGLPASKKAAVAPAGPRKRPPTPTQCSPLFFF